MVPNNIKNCNSINKFKNSIKSWKPNECPCILCKIYIAQVGFIWFTSPFCDISEEKKDYVYFVFFEIFYIHFVFVHCSEWRSFAWFPAKGIFFFLGGDAPSLQIFWAIRPRVCGDGEFPGDFLAGKLAEIIVFFAVLYIYLFIITIIIIIIIIMIIIIIFIIIIIIILVGVN